MLMEVAFPDNNTFRDNAILLFLVVSKARDLRTQKRSCKISPKARRIAPLPTSTSRLFSRKLRTNVSRESVYEGSSLPQAGGLHVIKRNGDQSEILHVN